MCVAVGSRYLLKRRDRNLFVKNIVHGIRIGGHNVRIPLEKNSDLEGYLKASSMSASWGACVRSLAGLRVVFAFPSSSGSWNTE
jgi:hypothetical protein